jgi:antitoxin VapB
MVIHVRDAETDGLVRRLAEKQGSSLTDTIREAVEDKLEAVSQKQSLWERTAQLRERISRYPLTGQKADKAFFDDLSD